MTGAEEEIGMAEEDDEADGLLLLPPGSSEANSCSTVDELWLASTESSR